MTQTYESLLAKAYAFQRLFDGAAARWSVAGALRRRVAGGNKVQHVVIPSLAAPPQSGSSRDWRLFNRLAERAQQLGAVGRVELRPPPAGSRFGDRCLALRCDDIDHELYCCSAENWGCVLVIRTGPPAFVVALAERLLDRGYELHGNWLRSWRPGPDDTPPKTIDCPDEESLFRFAGISTVTEPWKRK